MQYPPVKPRLPTSLPNPRCSLLEILVLIHLNEGKQRIDQRVRVVTPEKDCMPTWKAWLDVQEGADVETVEKHGNWLLPMAFPEGSPMHPSYGIRTASRSALSPTTMEPL